MSRTQAEREALSAALLAGLDSHGLARFARMVTLLALDTADAGESRAWSGLDDVWTAARIAYGAPWVRS